MEILFCLINRTPAGNIGFGKSLHSSGGGVILAKKICSAPPPVVSLSQTAFAKPWTLAAIISMIRLLIILIPLLLFEYCNLSKTNRHNVHPVPKVFDDTLTAVISRLKTQNYDYIVYEEKYGNCFGPSLYAFARIIWTDGTRSFRRDLDARSKELTDILNEKDSKNLFDYFINNRLDTISVLPNSHAMMDPVSYGDILVRKEKSELVKRFELGSYFATKDTTHLLNVFIQKVLN